MSDKKTRLSKISALHYFKLIFRSILFICAAASYVVNRIQNSGKIFGEVERLPVILGIIWIVFVLEMLLRFFPSNAESMGCQKQFKKNFIPTKHTEPAKRSPSSTFLVAAAWFALNAIIGVLYYTNVIDEGILLLISLAYSVCDMICILFFCPFQTWFMKNKCCGSCRIYNWDFAMMFTPLVFIPDFYTWSLLGIALLLLTAWEISVRMHPERFSEETNACLSCTNCKEKLCHHKKQLRHFLRTNRRNLILKGNAIIDKAKNATKKQQ